MIGKFASTLRLEVLTSLILTIFLAMFQGTPGLAQSTPAGQAPATPPAGQQPAAQTPPAQKPDTGQEPADEESTMRRKKPHDYKNWTFNAGAGANVDSGPTHTFVRGGGFAGSAGVARNANKYLGLRADVIFADLPLRDSTQQLALATGATSYAYSVTLDPIINLQVTKQWGGYILFGPAFTHRTGSLKGDTTVPGSGCSAFWKWWGACTNAALPLSGNFVDTSQNAFGYNFGIGASRKMPSGVELYAEYRFMHGSHNGVTTDYRPITIGFRW